MRILLLICTILLLLLLPSLVKGSEIVEISDILLLPDSTSLNEQSDKLISNETYQLGITLTTNSNSEITGVLTFDQRHTKGYDWQIQYDSLSESHSGFLNEIPIRLNAYDKVNVTFKVDELDRTKKGKVALRFVEKDQHRQDLMQMHISQAFVIGIMIFLFVFNVILNVVTKWNVYGKYAIYILSALLYLIYYFDYTQYILPTETYLSVNIISILYSLIFVFYFWFLMALGQYEQTVPRAAYYLKIGIYYKLFQMALEIPFYLLGFKFIDQDWYKYTFLIFEIALISLIIFNILKAKDFRGKVVILASAFLIVSAIFAQLETGYESVYILEVGILSELLIFSVALGYISKKYFEEKNINQSLYVEQLEKNKAIQLGMNIKLEEQVSERTKDLKMTTAKLQDKINENQILFGEIHHRVKNNMQMISSMLKMQQRRMVSSDGQKAISETLSRIETIALIHEHLYKDFENFDIDIHTYITQLCEMIKKISGQKQIDIEVDSPQQKTSIENAISLGVILHELITNSIKYCEPANGEISIKVSIKIEKTGFKLVVKDNGLTAQPEIGKGYGFYIINVIIKDEENMHFSIDQDGFKVRIKLPFQ